MPTCKTVTDTQMDIEWNNNSATRITDKHNKVYIF